MCKGFDSEKGHVAFIVPYVKYLHAMKNAQKTAGKTASTGFYWKHIYTLNCDALSASRLGHLIRLLDDYTQGHVSVQELELADPEVSTAFRFITSEIERGAR